MKNKGLMYLLISLVLIALAYFAFSMNAGKESDTESGDDSVVVDSIDQTDTDLDAEEIEEEEEVVVEEDADICSDVATLPAGYIYQENPTYDYKIGMPDTWYYRYFDSARLIGLDKNPVPTASEYAGLITFYAKPGTLASYITDMESQLDEYDQTEVVVNCLTWTRITGVTQENMVSSGNLKAIISAIDIDGQLYTLAMESDSSTYATNLVIYNKVLESIVFGD